MKVSMRKSTYA